MPEPILAPDIVRQIADERRRLEALKRKAAFDVTPENDADDAWIAAADTYFGSYFGANFNAQMPTRWKYLMTRTTRPDTAMWGDFAMDQGDGSLSSAFFGDRIWPGSARFQLAETSSGKTGWWFGPGPEGSRQAWAYVLARGAMNNSTLVDNDYDIMLKIGGTQVGTNTVIATNFFGDSSIRVHRLYADSDTIYSQSGFDKKIAIQIARYTSSSKSAFKLLSCGWGNHPETGFPITGSGA